MLSILHIRTARIDIRTDVIHLFLVPLTQSRICPHVHLLGSQGAFMISDEELISGLQRSKELGALPMVSQDRCTLLRLVHQYPCI